MERMLVSLVERSDRHRVRHVVCTLRAGGSLFDRLPPHVPRIALELNGRHRLSAFRLASIIRGQRPEFVHARNFNTWVDCELAGRMLGRQSPTLILGYHGCETAGGLSRARQRRARWLRLPRHPFTTVSHAGRQELIETLGVADDRVMVIPNGVDTHRFSPCDRRRRRLQRGALSLDDSDFVIVMIANLVPVKDHAAALDALGQLSQAQGRHVLLVVGDGPLRWELEVLSRRLTNGVDIRFLGHRDDVSSLLQVADVFLSCSRYEQSSNALLEAMSVGLPCVVTDVGDNARPMDPMRGGWVVPAGDVAAIARALVSIRDSESMRSCGAKIRSHIIESFNIDTTIERYTCYYESLVKRAASRRNAHPTRRIQSVRCL